ncbi:hypothetical protein AGLY_012298 [Aphis glycines]|uniref:Uncharacterized protein n=1 Tax=Aphis glycines TaxID=307491 RepID=A0A6G0T9P7_APHGL|nr:hypothetical protein AGLY_012298 [Aphis glycines]
MDLDSRACGLYRFDENAVDFNKCIANRSFNTLDVSSISNNDLKSDVLPRTIDEFVIVKHAIKFILQDKLLVDNGKIRLIIEECIKVEMPGKEKIQSNVDGFLNFDVQIMPKEILDDTFNLYMFDDTGNIFYYKYDEKKTDKLLINSEENNGTLTLNCDEQLNRLENNKTVTMNNENKASKSENTINDDNSIIIEHIRTEIKISNLSESSIYNIWSTHFPWLKTPSHQKSKSTICNYIYEVARNSKKKKKNVLCDVHVRLKLEMARKRRHMQV